MVIKMITNILILATKRLQEGYSKLTGPILVTVSYLGSGFLVAKDINMLAMDNKKITT
jgi:hypothetical protein